MRTSDEQGVSACSRPFSLFSLSDHITTLFGTDPVVALGVSHMAGALLPGDRSSDVMLHRPGCGREMEKNTPSAMLCSRSHLGSCLASCRSLRAFMLLLVSSLV